MMGEDLPREFGPYTLRELISRGGMAEIYRATTTGIGNFQKTVAIKTILPHLAEDEDFISMLIDEAQIVESLDHSNIAQVYDLGQIERRYYIAMEYVHGVDLHDVVEEFNARGGYMPVPHVVHVLSRVCAALHYAHTRTDAEGHPLDIVHRDVSLHNILIGAAGEVKLIDFGVAKIQDHRVQTQTGGVKGKLLYMSPEQAQAEALDGRADLFSAGLCAYKMLTGRLPFEGDNEYQVYNNVVSKDIPPPSALRPEMSEELDRIVMQLLQRDPEARYQEGYGVRQDLDSLLHELEPGYTAHQLSRFVDAHVSHLVGADPSTLDATSDASREASGRLATSTPLPRAPETSERRTDELNASPRDGGERMSSQETIASADESPRGAFSSHLSSSNANRADASSPRCASTSADDTSASRQRPNTHDSDETSSFPNGDRSPLAWGIAALSLAIVAMIGYGLQSEAWTSKRATLDSQNSRVAAGSRVSSRVQMTLETNPNGVEQIREDTVISRTPITFSLPRDASGRELMLRKEGHRERTFCVVPLRDLERSLELTSIVRDGSSRGRSELSDIDRRRHERETTTISK